MVKLGKPWLVYAGPDHCLTNALALWLPVMYTVQYMPFFKERERLKLKQGDGEPLYPLHLLVVLSQTNGSEAHAPFTFLSCQCLYTLCSKSKKDQTPSPSLDVTKGSASPSHLSFPARSHSVV